MRAVMAATLASKSPTVGFIWARAMVSMAILQIVTRETTILPEKFSERTDAIVQARRSSSYKVLSQARKRVRAFAYGDAVLNWIMRPIV